MLKTSSRTLLFITFAQACLFAALAPATGRADRLELRQRAEGPSGTAAFLRQPGPAVVIDRLMVIVNGQPITLSELGWQAALDPEVPPGKPEPELLQRILQQMIDLKLLAQEAEKLPAGDVEEAEITKYLADLISQFPSEAAFRERVASAGLDAATLRERVKQRVEILRFIDFRFRAFVLVTPQEVEHYYQTHIEAEARKQGTPVPPLDQVRETIERDLADSKVATEMTAWFEDQRRRSEVVMLDQGGD
ncbi:MAG: hypothetical protein HY650_11350 [Acidobacteria bacterium]|nr:hypothetical protein [Acidobacteriota bacterium]